MVNLSFRLAAHQGRARTQTLDVAAPGFLHPLPGDDDPLTGIGNQAASHRHPKNPRPADLAEDDTIEFAFELHEFVCPDVHGLFARLFAHRTALFPEAHATPPPDVLPFSAAWDLLEHKHNAENWRDSHGLYTLGIEWVPDQASQFWQNGWTGGGITSFAMMQEGSPLSLERAARNLDFLLTRAVSERGLFKATMSESGLWKGDSSIGGDEAWCRREGAPDTDTMAAQTLSLARRQGDCLLFALRQLLLWREGGRPVPETWTRAVRRAADALCEV